MKELMVAKGRSGIETAPTSEYVAGAGFHLYYPERGGLGPGNFYTRPPWPATIERWVETLKRKK